MRFLSRQAGGRGGGGGLFSTLCSLANPFSYFVGIVNCRFAEKEGGDIFPGEFSVLLCRSSLGGGGLPVTKMGRAYLVNITMPV